MALARERIKSLYPLKGLSQLTELVAEGENRAGSRGHSSRKRMRGTRQCLSPRLRDAQELREETLSLGPQESWQMGQIAEESNSGGHFTTWKEDLTVFMRSSDPVAMRNSVGNTLHGFLALTSP